MHATHAEQRARQGLAARYGRRWILPACDALTLAGSFWLLVLLRKFFFPILPLEHYVGLTPALLIAPLFGLALGSCQRIALPPQRELKALSLATTLGFAAILILIFATKSGEEYSRTAIMGAWLLSLFTVPIVRGRVRRRLCRLPWWSSPLILIGREGANEMWADIERHPERGLRPVARLDEPFINGELHPDLAAWAATRPEAMVLALPDAAAALEPRNEEEAPPLLQLARRFSGVLLVPPVIAHNPFIWLTPRDLGNSVALLVRQNLHDSRRLLLKRILDLAIIALCAVPLLLLGGVIALCIKWDSPGPVIYRQERIGRGGRRMRVCKFRTMVRDADAVLARRLREDEELRREWERDQKLKNDPRITRVGAFLRRVSLDELPQLWNVLWGEMSLVGPRPIVEGEVEKYRHVFEEYLRVRPGLTGLWQISGRNDTSYAERVRLDQYYVSNWSVWFDIWILARTVPVVLSGRGAY